MRYTTVTIRYRPRQQGRDQPIPEPRDGRASIEIDLNAIEQQIAHKALRSKTGRATAYGGLIKAKVIR